MDLTQLRYFETIARLGNLSRAARELFVTQPNLSKSMARLESELNVPLFDRRKGKITLNEYGRVFLSSVTLSLGELDTGVSAVRRLYESSQNTLSLGCSIDDFLPDVLKEFSPLHPEIGIRQFSCDPTELARRLQTGALDLAITPYAVETDFLTFEELGQMPFVIFLSDRHPLAERASVAVSELAGERFICDRSRMDAQRLRSICSAGGFQPDIAFEVESSDLLYRLVAEGSGIACLPMAQLTKVYRDAPDRRRLRMLTLTDPLPTASLGLLYRRDYAFTSAASCLRDFLRFWLGREADQLRDLGYTPPPV